MAGLEFLEAGNELELALGALLDVKGRQAHLEDLRGEHEALEAREEKLAAKLAQTKIDQGKKLSVFSQDISTREAKLRSDLRHEDEKKTWQQRGQNPEKIETAIFEDLLPRAASAQKGLRTQALTCIEAERDLTAIMLEKSMLSERPFRERQEKARAFGLALFHVGGLNVKFSQVEVSLGETSALSKKLSELEDRLKIAEGELTKFWPIVHEAETVDGVLCFAIPEKRMTQLLDCWMAARVAGAKAVRLVLDEHRLKWSFKKNLERAQGVGVATSDYETGSSLRK